MSGAWGMELKQENKRDGVVDDGSIAWPERVEQAAVQWPQAAAEDFELVGRRRWRDRASGVLYRQASGCPLLAIGTDATRDVIAFFVTGGRLVFLEPADRPEGTCVVHGQVISRELDIQLRPQQQDIY